MSWSNCMKDKIVHHYGDEVKGCIDGITHGNLSKIAKCIADADKEADPFTILTNLTEWSAECLFG